MSKWFLWDTVRHKKVETGFYTKAEAKRYKTKITNGVRRDAFINVFRMNVVPATDARLADPINRGYYYRSSNQEQP